LISVGIPFEDEDTTDPSRLNADDDDNNDDEVDDDDDLLAEVDSGTFDELMEDLPVE
jgi:hypothetical protein